ncbi:MAG: peroxiredoxin [Myxococcales bacterium]|nr:peroxiredoxin [Myxococcales bacterium]MCB9565739.1 peroxiredoxin [Myxococcales bacterium]MCB9703116.1 peroxiredoxin [Myxococcales bacterium]
MSRALLLSLGLVAAAALPTLIACQPVQRPDGGQGPIAVGAPAPALTATDHRGQTIDLAALRGQPVLVYFYPKDGTPGCTKEACAIRDAWERFGAAGVVVLGVSSDEASAHVAFADEHKLPFSLIADTDLTWAKAFGVEVSFKIIHRSSFLIDREGKIAKVYIDVDPGVHAEEVLADVAKLGGAS